MAYKSTRGTGARNSWLVAVLGGGGGPCWGNDSRCRGGLSPSPVDGLVSELIERVVAHWGSSAPLRFAEPAAEFWFVSRAPPEIVFVCFILDNAWPWLLGFDVSVEVRPVCFSCV